MSVEIEIHIKCDGCGSPFSLGKRHSVGAVPAPWQIKDILERHHWTVVKRGRLPAGHYCETCASKPAKPIPRKPRVSNFTAPNISADDMYWG